MEPLPTEAAFYKIQQTQTPMLAEQTRKQSYARNVRYLKKTIKDFIYALLNKYEVH
jgi:hypothetical protein